MIQRDAVPVAVNEFPVVDGRNDLFKDLSRFNCCRRGRRKGNYPKLVYWIREVEQRTNVFAEEEIEELSQAILVSAKEIDTLLDSLPGIGRSDSQQVSDIVWFPCLVLIYILV